MANTNNTDDKSNCTPRDDTSGELTQFQRNLFFHGKLMTARDMELEQRYHAQRLETLARSVSGTGIICGFETDVEETDAGDLRVTVHPGVGLDSSGRPVVVASPDEVTFTSWESAPLADPDGDPDPAGVSIFLTYDDCRTEKVPIGGAEDACTQSCTYNRIIEFYDVDVRRGAPQGPKPIPNIDFPEESAFDDTSGHAETERELQTMAEEYASALGHDTDSPCEEIGPDRLFLGYFEPQEDGKKWREEDDDVVPYRVYTNDMLYAVIARHVADFENPHQVSLLGRDGAENAAEVFTEYTEESVTIRADNTIDVSWDGDTDTVDLERGEWLTELQDDVKDLRNDHNSLAEDYKTLRKEHDALDDRVDLLERYVMDKTLKYKYRLFDQLATRYAGSALGEEAEAIAAAAQQAIKDREFDDNEAFAEVIRNLYNDFESELPRLLDEHDGIEIDEDADLNVEDALEALEALLSDGEATVLEIALAQDEVCESIEVLEHHSLEHEAGINPREAELVVDEEITFSVEDLSGESSTTAAEWDFGDETTATGLEVTHAFDAAGEYSVEMVAEANTGGTSVDVVTISVIEIEEESLKIHTSPGESDIGQYPEISVTPTTEIAHRDHLLFSVPLEPGLQHALTGIEPGAEVAADLGSHGIYVDIYWGDDEDPIGTNDPEDQRLALIYVGERDDEELFWIPHPNDSWEFAPPEQTYRIEYRVTTDNEAIEEPSMVIHRSREIDRVHREIDLDEGYEQIPQEEVTISGVATIAPGTDVHIRIRGSGGLQFDYRTTTAVTPDGTFAIDFDASEIPGGTIDIFVRDLGTGDTYEFEATIGEVSDDPTVFEPIGGEISIDHDTFEHIEGIGEAYTEALFDIGITTEEELVQANHEELAAELEVSSDEVSKWIDQAR